MNGGGTSYAAPQVAATIAMMLMVNDNLTPAQCYDYLETHGNLSTLHDFIELDAGAAVNAVIPNKQ